jgi:hypothetical protein
MGGYTTAISGQQLGENVPVTMQHILNNATVGRNNKELRFLCWPCRDVISKGQGQLSQLRIRSVRESVKRGLEPVAQE